MYDAIVVGARCGGSPTAMLLARKGHKVLLLDKASFPSDILSTHFIHQPGVVRLQRWGLFDAVVAANTPLITNVKLVLAGVAFNRPPPPPDAPVIPALCPRRTVLDKILVDGAVAAGAELREGFAVRELTFKDGVVTGVRGEVNGSAVTEEARMVIGADGMHSLVAKQVKAPEYKTIPTLSYGYYAYWSGVPQEGAELYLGANNGILAFPTNDGMSCIAVGGRIDEFHEFRQDIEGHYMKVMDQTDDLGPRMKHAKRETKFQGTGDQPNFFRKPYGPGWALVGDAGYHRDFVTGLGITDAFRDAELLAEAVDAGFSGSQPLDEAMAGYEQQRNEIAEPLYEATTTLAALNEPPSVEVFIKFVIAMQKMMPEVGANAGA